MGNKYAIVASESMRNMAQNVYDGLMRRNITDKIGGLDFQVIKTAEFACQEILPSIPENVRNRHVFYFQDTQFPNPCYNWANLQLTLDALSLANASKISLVLPYMAWSRQDKKDFPSEKSAGRNPISSAVFANSLKIFPKLEEIVTFDLHADQITGFYRPGISVDNIPADLVFAEYIQQTHGGNPDEIIVCSPDHGGEKRAERFSVRAYGSNEIGSFSKRRPDNNESKLVGYHGPSLKGKIVLIYDDLVDTAGSILNVGTVAKEMEAEDVYVCTPHGVLSKKGDLTAEQKIRESGLKALMSNSIPRSTDYYAQNSDWLTVVSLDPLIEAILYEQMTDGSVSDLLRSRRAWHN
jgi:ribose-phosphate pyrophosphokinase